MSKSKLWAGAVTSLVAILLVGMGVAGSMVADVWTPAETLAQADPAAQDRLATQADALAQACQEAAAVEIPDAVATDERVTAAQDALGQLVTTNCQGGFYDVIQNLVSGRVVRKYWTTFDVGPLADRAGQTVDDLQTALDTLDGQVAVVAQELAVAAFQAAKTTADPVISQARTVLDGSAGKVEDETTRTSLEAVLTPCETATALDTATATTDDVTAATSVLQDCAASLPPLVEAVQASQAAWEAAHQPASGSSSGSGSSNKGSSSSSGGSSSGGSSSGSSGSGSSGGNSNSGGSSSGSGSGSGGSSSGGSSSGGSSSGGGSSSSGGSSSGGSGNSGGGSSSGGSSGGSGDGQPTKTNPSLGQATIDRDTGTAVRVTVTVYDPDGVGFTVCLYNGNTLAAKWPGKGTGTFHGPVDGITPDTPRNPNAKFC